MKRSLALVLAAVGSLTVLPPGAPAHAEPAGLSVTGWALDGSPTSLVSRNAAGMSTLSVASIKRYWSDSGIETANV